MSIDMLDTVADPFNTQPSSGVVLQRPAPDGHYDYDNGGVWVPGTEPAPVYVPQINIQPARAKHMEVLLGMGGTANPRDARVIYINDGSTYLYPEDSGRPADRVDFSDGLSFHRWRVMESDNRPWHNYCRAIVERTDEAPAENPTTFVDTDGNALVASGGEFWAESTGYINKFPIPTKQFDVDDVDVEWDSTNW